MRKIFLILSFSTFVFLDFMPVISWACACGCGVFNVGTSSMFPSGQGGRVFTEYDFMDQNRNWSKDSKASADGNSDKRIRTSFTDTGFQYMFNRKWGIQADLPYDHRYFKATDDAGGIVSFRHSAVGDMRIQGIYTGFSADMSTGLEFGFKVPTGDWTYPNFDRDTELGTGSTDALLGAYHRGAISASVGYFVQNLLDQPFLTQGGYRPGTEDDAVAGVDYNGLSAGSVRVTPIGEVENSYRSRDRGWAANPADSGYERILLAPGLELDYKRFMVFFDVGFPVYQHINGDQLVAGSLYKVVVSYKF
ncbi:MAG: hypothetical protein KGJ09_02420 [Candidatus Omnitrophica bacterium]|nr:hypothetical protein [Candidatus Omnitrophota bacterium]MDE2008913.1 hypothetical protein [Candidatus Omnitrophota bacterium]MDE2213524.1 hypothetical protein [Candidatus Omnitrophota bacterium]MDE2230575.1 hypothetical protein [Candidatus Omnitrophota bacterium]